MKTTRFKRGDTAYWPPKSPNTIRAVSVVDTYDFKEAVRVADSNVEWLVGDKEILTEDEVADAVKALEEKRHEKKKSKAETRLARVVEMWKDGLHTPKEMAARTHEWPIQYVSQIASARRWGFIK